MDEYLFLVMAKLKADRRKLERERLQAAATASMPSAAHSDTRPAAEARDTHRLLTDLEWREQS